MTRLLRIFIALLVSLPLFVSAIGKDHTLNGKIKIKGGDTYPYQLVLQVSGTSVKGYSVTKTPDGVDTKTSVTGIINKKKRVLLITETKLLSAQRDDMDICFVNAVLTYKKKSGNYVVSGVFQGKDAKRNDCGQGSIEFTQAVGVDDLFETDTASPSSTATKAEPVAIADKNQVTEGVQKELTWHTDSCTLEVWDGGVIDGDVISVLVNNEEVLAKYTLGKVRKQLKFPISKKINSITIIAEEEGLNPPNTAELMFYDGKESYGLTAFNKKGAKATVIIRKQ